MKRSNIDNEKEFDWGRTSGAYAAYRPGYPENFYDTLHALGIGREGQKILDLGTGTGVLARAFARRGATVKGIDIAENQIEQARKLAEVEGLGIEFEVCPSESMAVTDGSLDVVSAGQSWLYFDRDVVIPKVLGALKEDGCLVMTTLAWLPYKDSIARQSDELVLKYNPEWKGAFYNGVGLPLPRSVERFFDLKSFHVMHEPLPFTRESWRGRFRACRGVGASLSDEEVETFDQELDRLLREIAPECFTILHEMVIQVFARKGELMSEL